MDDVITIRNMGAEDVELVFEWRNDPRVRKYMFNSDPIELNDHAAWFDKMCQNPQRHLLLVCKGVKPFGFVQFNINECRKVADWGFYVDPISPKGQGAVLGHAALNYGFKTLSLNKIYGQVLVENSKSLAFHKKLGFTEEEIFQTQHFSANKYQDIHLLGLLAKEWERVKTNTCVYLGNKVKY
jgi:UDP-4-amino-4,6-dideoxy-N-acetyl-beta-L-altrosamine N-acetyltransferase